MAFTIVIGLAMRNKYGTFKLEVFHPEVLVQYNGVKVSKTQQ
jgi:hypothetical protein